jgi:polysaccharide biosynthesis transport protein
MNKSLTSIPSILMRHWLPSALVFSSVMAGAIAYLKITPQLYEAKAQLTLDDRQVSVSNLGHDLAKLPEGGVGSPNPLATEAELLKSPTLLKRALVKVAGAKNVPPMSQLSKELRVKIVPATNILELSYRGHSPELTAELLNAITAAAVEENLNTIRAGASSIKEFLEAEVPKQRARLEQLEAAENRYRQENQLVAVEDQTKELVQSLETIQNQERDLSTQLQEAIVRNASLRQLSGSVSSQSALTSVRVGQDEELKTLRVKLNDLEARVIEARSRFSESNPILVSLTEQRDEARKFYETKLARIVPKSESESSSPEIAGDALSQDLIAKSIASNIDRAAIEQKLAMVKKIRIALQAQLANLPNLQQPLTTLTRNREESAATLKLLQAKLQEASIAKTQLVSNLKIIAPAERPTQPEWPKTSAVLSIAAALGLMLTTGVVLLLAYLDNCLHDSSEAELMLGQTTLGRLPSFPRDSILLQQGEFTLETYHLVEPYRKLLKTLKFRHHAQIRRLVIGSALANEGKSTVAAHLAMVAAMESRRTLLIDANLWHPEQHRLFNIPTSPGLTEVLEGKLTLEQSVQPTGIANLSLLTCGNLTHSSFGLESARMKSLLAEAEGQFDLVIVDTPALVSSMDAFEWSHYSNGLVLVVCPGVTTRNGLAQAWSEIHKDEVPFLGFVVNRVNLPIDRDYFRTPRLKKVSQIVQRRLPSSKPE